MYCDFLQAILQHRVKRLNTFIIICVADKGGGMEINMGKRQFNIDFLRGAMIIFVMIGHAIDLLLQKGFIDRIVGDWIYAIIYTFHMPIMFSISGYVSAYSVHNNQKLYKVIGKELFSLYVPYLFINYLYWLERLLANNILSISLEKQMRFSLKSILELLYIGDGATWFLLALLLIRIVSIIIRRSLPIIWEPIVFSFFFWLAYLGYGGTLIYYLSWGLFYEIGYLVNKHKIDQSENKTFNLSLSIMLFNIVAIGIVNLLGQGREGLNSCTKFLIGGGLFVILLIVTKNIPQIKVINFCGEHSMMQYMVHILSQFVSFYILSKVFTSPAVLICMMIIFQITLSMIVYICYKKIKWLNWIEIFFYPYAYFHRKSKLRELRQSANISDKIG